MCKGKEKKTKIRLKIGETSHMMLTFALGSTFLN
jgi:hypothetical protein